MTTTAPLAELDPEIREDILEHVPSATLAKALGEMDSDDAVDVVEDLEDDKRAQVLAAMPEAARSTAQEGLAQGLAVAAQSPPPVAGASAPKSKLVAGLLGILVGAFGVHRFYLGYTTIAIIQLVLGLLGIVTCGITTIASGIWGLIEGILILTGSINRDAKGVPLAD